MRERIQITPNMRTSLSASCSNQASIALCLQREIGLIYPLCACFMRTRGQSSCKQIIDVIVAVEQFWLNSLIICPIIGRLLFQFFPQQMIVVVVVVVK